MRRSIPTEIPAHGPVSCKTPWIYNYDANGHRRWCSDCGAELVSNDEVIKALIGSDESGEAHDVPNWAISLFIVVVAGILALVMVLAASGRPRANPERPMSTPVGVQPLPAPGEAPEPRPNTVPDAGLRPYFGDPS